MRLPTRLLPSLAGFAAALGPAAAAARADVPAAPYVPGQVVVRYAARTPLVARAATDRAAGAVALAQPKPATAPFRVLRLRAGTSVPDALRRLRSTPGVLAAVPNYRVSAAGQAGAFFPRDPGSTSRAGAWTRFQWNFLQGAGVDAPGAWANLIAAGHPGGSGVRIAVLDTGVAYRNWGHFRRSPDFATTRFADPYDFVAHNRFPLDRDGHGTHVTGTLAEETNNRVGVTGLAYGATLIPVRVIGPNSGDVEVAAGIRYAVQHHAQVINMSLEFPDRYATLSPADIPDVIDAINYAHRRGVVVVAASGNEGPRVSYPARAQHVVAVGASTVHRCLADYSNHGEGIDLVAPGGGDDAYLPQDPNCHVDDPSGRPIYQETLLQREVTVRRHGRVVGSSTRADAAHFGLQPVWAGTSMASPHVAATAALIIASGVIGPHPSPDAVAARLESTARDLGTPGYDLRYGYGLVDAARATAP